MIESTLLARVPGLRHGLTTRAEGSLGPVESPEAQAARSAAVRALGGDASRLVVPHQVHGAVVATVGEPDAGRGHGAGPALAGTDGLVSRTPGLPLLVQGADCPLVLLAAADGSAVGLVHSGWRGTVARIAAAGVAALDLAPDGVVAAVFPGIGPCCYEVGPEVLSAVDDAFGAQAAAWAARTDRPGHARLDLGAAITATLTEAGIPPAAIDRVPGCTACDGRLWSHRASGGAKDRSALVALLEG